MRVSARSGKAAAAHQGGIYELEPALVMMGAAAQLNTSRGVSQAEVGATAGAY
jgi:hypothetical protein